MYVHKEPMNKKDAANLNSDLPSSMHAEMAVQEKGGCREKY